MVYLSRINEKVIQQRVVERICSVTLFLFGGDVICTIYSVVIYVRLSVEESRYKNGTESLVNKRK